MEDTIYARSIGYCPLSELIGKKIVDVFELDKCKNNKCREAWEGATIIVYEEGDGQEIAMLLAYNDLGSWLEKESMPFTEFISKYLPIGLELT